MTMNKYHEAAGWIDHSQGIVVCAANGFSLSEGFAILRPSPWFRNNFHDYIGKFGIQSPLQGLNYPYRDPGDFSNFYSRLMALIHYDKPISPIMKTLKQITADRPSFIVTTNVEDRFVQAGYPEDHVFYMEGRLDYRKDHSPIKEEELSSIRSIRELETDSYPGGDAFNKKLRDLNEFLHTHPKFTILVLGVSAGNGFLRPLIRQMLALYPQSRLIELNLERTHPADTERILDIPGSLTESLERIRNNLVFD